MSNTLNFFKYLFNYRLIVIFFIITAVPPVFAQTWIDDSFEDFAKGILDASGNNIYFTKSGTIRTIHHYDYNQDGYIDLIFGQTHDLIHNLPATLATVSTSRSIDVRELSDGGSIQVINSDLNKDGYEDLVFCQNHNGIQHPRRFVTIVYGGEDGWPHSRSTGHLPGMNLKAVAIADINKDGWDDIITLNSEAWLPNQPAGNIVRIYWGNDRGYLNTRFHDVGVPNAFTMSSGDYDNDGYKDICLLGSDSVISFLWGVLPGKENYEVVRSTLDTHEKNQLSIASGDVTNDGVTDLVIGTNQEYIYIIPSQGKGKWGEMRKVSAFPATHISIGDLNSDNINDIVLSYFAQHTGPKGEYGGSAEGSGIEAQILWGAKEGTFFKDNVTKLDAPDLTSSAIGDYDGDGKMDVAIAINKGETRFEGESIIYYGSGGKQFEKGSKGVPTSGASHVLAVRLNEKSIDQAIFCNSIGGTLDEEVPIYLYWGGPEGFTENNRAEIPFRSGYEATSADFNADGFPDVAIMNEMHGGQKLEDDKLAGANIFYGGPDGFDFSIENRTIISEALVGSSNTADLNKDGYLDLVLGQYIRGDNNESYVIIYYGSEDGFTRENRVEIPCPGRSLSIQLADYDKDGWLDIAANSYNEVGIRIFYGSEDGFDFNRRVELDAPAVCDNNTADLNNDGWLDILVCSYNDIANNKNHDMGSLIYWGGPDGFKYSNTQWLPGFTPLGPVIADFDNDGFLDIFNPHYHGDGVREMIPSYLFWGSSEGFRRDNRTDLINNSGSQGFAADFNKDGLMDLAVSNHTDYGNHNTLSKIYYNSGDRFRSARIEKIPTIGPHWSHGEDMGHIYDRSWTQSYESSVFNWSKKRTEGVLKVHADIPEGTQLNLEIRSAENTTTLSDKKWIRVNSSGSFEVDTRDRFIQYKAVFVSDNGDRFPVLDKITLSVSDK